MSRLSRITATGVLVLLAAGVAIWKYRDYVTNPWTRNAQVRAKVVQVAPRVSAPIVELPVRDNQFVSAGDLLFIIDPSTYQARLDEMEARYDDTLDKVEALEKQVEAAKASVEQARQGIRQAQSTVKSAQAQLDDAEATYQRFRRLVREGSVSVQSFDNLKAEWQVALASKESADAALLKANDALIQAQATLAQARAERGVKGEGNAQIRAAKADIEEARLDLSFTEVRAAVDGYVTNLNLRLGTQAVANQPALALVDINSFWIDAYFRETVIRRIKAGDRAVVTLMSYPDTPLTGTVESIGWGISTGDGSTGFELLPVVEPTYEWIRLAQRVPVRIVLTGVPSEIRLRIGLTASVLVITGSAESPEPAGSVPAAPAPLL